MDGQPIQKQLFNSSAMVREPDRYGGHMGHPMLAVFSHPKLGPQGLVVAAEVCEKRLGSAGNKPADIHDDQQGMSQYASIGMCEEGLREVLIPLSSDRFPKPQAGANHDHQSEPGHSRWALSLLLC